MNLAVFPRQQFDASADIRNCLAHHRCMVQSKKSFEYTALVCYLLLKVDEARVLVCVFKQQYLSNNFHGTRILFNIVIGFYPLTIVSIL
jgi:hypothetical protein